MLYMFGKTTRVAPKRSRKRLRPHPPTSPRVSPKFEDLSEIENKSCARKRPSRPQRADQTLAKPTRPISEHLIPLAPRRFHLRAFALEPSLAPIFLHGFFAVASLRRKKKESKRVPCASLKLLPLMFIAVSRMFLKCTLKSVPRALHDFVASLDSRAYLTIV